MPRKSSRTIEDAAADFYPGMPHKWRQTASDYQLGLYAVGPKQPRCDNGALQTEHAFPIKGSCPIYGSRDCNVDSIARDA